MNYIEIRGLLYADDLVLLSPTKDGRQQHLNLLQRFCQTWAFTINTAKNKIMIFQKQARNQVNTNYFYLDTTKLQHTKKLHIPRPQHHIHRKFQHGCERSDRQSKESFLCKKIEIKIYIPIQICLKIFQFDLEPILLYSSEIWSPKLNNEFDKWDKSIIESFHSAILQSILQVQRKTPNNACREELGQYLSY